MYPYSFCRRGIALGAIGWLTIIAAPAWGFGGQISTSSPCNLAGADTCSVNVTSSATGFPYTMIWLVSSAFPNDPQPYPILSASFGSSGGPYPFQFADRAGVTLQLRGYATQPAPVQASFYTGYLLASTIAYGTGVFADIAANQIGINEIEAIYRVGVTLGCSASPLNFCPTPAVTRLQMAIFIERALHGIRQGIGYSAPTATNPFSDVVSDSLGMFAVRAYADGIILPCATTPTIQFCPNASVTRKDMAYMLLRAKYGGSYTPPSPLVTTFSDVDVIDRPWVEQLAKEGITTGCTATTYCPNDSVVRASMAIFLARTFALVNGQTTPLYYGYFGVTTVTPTSSTSSVVETARHSNLVFTGGWGDRSSASGIADITNLTVTYLRDAKSRGVGALAAMVDYLVYIGVSGSQYGVGKPWVPRSTTEAKGNLTAFFDRLRDEELLSLIVMVYPADEPEVYSLSNDQVSKTNSLVREVAAGYSLLKFVNLGVIYGINGTSPAMDSHDWLGFDAYSEGAGIFDQGARYDQFKQTLTTRQRIILVPGGGNPSHTDPGPFLTKANTDTQVITIMPFVWWDNTQDLGIRSNGKATAYCQVGAQIKGVSSTPCPN